MDVITINEKVIEDKAILVHGTTIDRIEGILKNGFDPQNGVWSCSDPHRAYFYELEVFAEKEGFDLMDEMEYCYYRMLSIANEQGQINNAFKENCDTKTCVFEFRIPKKYLEDEDNVCEDSSCPNSQHTGAIEIDIDYFDTIMADPETEIYIHYYPFFIKMSLVYIAGLIDNEYCENAIGNLSSLEYNLLKAMSNNSNTGDVYCDICDMTEIEETQIIKKP